ncbi:hypothetical protein [Wolbachia endosymbiont of Cantharis cryptica]|uniref:hypothetical protein n=1 Tax=Wolbachia endosymbiont of Cantharis cryptica TaxID=3066132 RepID=UPI00376ED803
MPNNKNGKKEAPAITSIDQASVENILAPEPPKGPVELRRSQQPVDHRPTSDEGEPYTEPQDAINREPPRETRRHGKYLGPGSNDSVLPRETRRHGKYLDREPDSKFSSVLQTERSFPEHQK